MYTAIYLKVSNISVALNLVSAVLSKLYTLIVQPPVFSDYFITVYL